MVLLHRHSLDHLFDTLVPVNHAVLSCWALADALQKRLGVRHLVVDEALEGLPRHDSLVVGAVLVGNVVVFDEVVQGIRRHVCEDSQPQGQPE